jgi:NADP-dependent 3-hydroxy acid dehydrogenase YdfG
VFEINDQHILVTGGSSSFGRHFARVLASNGAKVTLAARRAEALASALAEIGAAGGKAQSVILDVTLADSIDRAMEEAESRFGPIHAVNRQIELLLRGGVINWLRKRIHPGTSDSSTPKVA